MSITSTGQLRAGQAGINPLNNGNGNGNAGSYTTRQREEAALDHFAEIDKWGDNKLTEDSRTPWGKPNSVYHYAAGIDVVSCPGHGGMKLSPKRNRQIPASLRRSNGWYEEDCEFNIPAYFFPEETRPTKARGYSAEVAADEWQKECLESIKDWYPDSYEEITGYKLQPGESHERDRRLWNEQTKDKWKIHGVHPAKDGFHEVSVMRGEERRVIKMSETAYAEARKLKISPLQPGHETVIEDVDAFEDITPPPPAPEPRFKGFDLGKVSAAKMHVVESELAQRWRSKDGSVQTMEDILNDEGITGKRVFVANGKRNYRLNTGPFSFPVSKSLWDAVNLPDERTKATKLRERVQILEHRIEGDFRPSVEDRKKLQALRKLWLEARDEELATEKQAADTV